MAKGHNICWITERLFATVYRHKSSDISTLKYGKQLVKLYGPASPYLSIFSILRRDSANYSFNQFTNKIGYNELLAASAACGTLDDL